jgi:hypothetical protein
MLSILAVVALILVSIFIFTYLMFERYSKLKEREWMFLMRQDNNKALASLKITAYERLVVMLERSTPSSLVMRLNASATNSGILQLEMIRAIREEFDHNISLQMYVSEFCWNKVRKAREETSELIKVAYTKVRPESSSVDLSREIFKLESSTGNAAIREAIIAIREEMSRFF